MLCLIYILIALPRRKTQEEEPAQWGASKRRRREVQTDVHVKADREREQREAQVQRLVDVIEEARLPLVAFARTLPDPPARPAPRGRRQAAWRVWKLLKK